MSRCVACNKPLPSSIVYRSILIPHPTEQGKTTTMQIEDDMCIRCANKSRMTFQEDTSDEDIILAELGLNIIGIPEYE